MADNKFQYGFKLHRPLTNSMPRVAKVADAYQGSLSGNVDLGVGDPIILVSDGTVALCPGTEGTPGECAGVITAIDHWYDGTNIVRTNPIPGATTGGGVHKRQTTIHYIPAHQAEWEVMVDDTSTATTRAAYEAFIGENVNHVNEETSINGNPRMDPQLDISSHATTESLQWRILSISQTEENRDFSEDNVKLIVTGNDVQGPAVPATNKAGV